MTCTVCGGETRPIARTRNGYDLLRCKSCALVLSSPMPTPAELDAFYQGFAYSKPDETFLQRQVAHTERGTKRIVAEVAALTDRPIRKVLDFGGGLGFFANALSQHYERVTLFDLDRHSREFARQRFPGGFEVVDSADEALGQRYDLILLNQVIEHVPDPVGFLRPFRGALEPGGLLIVTTPNNRTNDALVRPDVLWHYVRRVAGPTPKAIRLLAQDSWLCCDPPRHLYAFNADNLRYAGEAAGFWGVTNATVFFDQDPLGQPKYANAGVGSAKAVAKSILYLVTKALSPLAHASDRRGERGTTLITYFTRDAS